MAGKGQVYDVILLNCGNLSQSENNEKTSNKHIYNTVKCSFKGTI